MLTPSSHWFTIHPTLSLGPLGSGKKNEARIFLFIIFPCTSQPHPSHYFFTFLFKENWQTRFHSHIMHPTVFSSYLLSCTAFILHQPPPGFPRPPLYRPQPSDKAKIKMITPSLLYLQKKNWVTRIMWERMLVFLPWKFIVFEEIIWLGYLRDRLLRLQ